MALYPDRDMILRDQQVRQDQTTVGPSSPRCGDPSDDECSDDDDDDPEGHGLDVESEGDEPPPESAMLGEDDETEDPETRKTKLRLCAMMANCENNDGHHERDSQICQSFQVCPRLLPNATTRSW